jgi:hypothetical protein
VAARKLGRTWGALLNLELRAAQAAVERGDSSLVEVDVLARLRIVAPADARPLQAALARLIQASGQSPA